MDESDRIFSRRHPWFAPVALVLFAVVMGGWHLLARGINADFGAGFAVGAVLAIVITAVAVGWRRGEMS